MNYLKITVLFWLAIVLTTNIQTALSFKIKSFYSRTYIASSSYPMILKKYQSTLYNANNDNTMDNDEDFRNRVRLKEEVASPYRKLRYFIYFSIIGKNVLPLYFSV